jgi:hypothetical protein
VEDPRGTARADSEHFVKRYIERKGVLYAQKLDTATPKSGRVTGDELPVIVLGT